MNSFNVPEMSCGHCTAAIEKAIKAIDPTATVSCDLGTRTVAVESFLSDRAVSEAIRNAGYDLAAPAAT
ncbi:MAG: heavy-metal-associated domain-containing protein [Rhodobacteraceae bacterium]|nr:heavy-metal-associated domain-containing protein [Paracoccaceae bacterium]